MREKKWDGEQFTVDSTSMSLGIAASQDMDGLRLKELEGRAESAERRLNELEGVSPKHGGCCHVCTTTESA